MDIHEQRQIRGEEASRILNSPVFEQAFTDVRVGILEAWAQLSTSDERRSEHSADLHKMLKCLDRVKRCLSETVTTGKLASKEIEGRRNFLGRRR